ncbi:DC1 - like 10 [Theobroma cacao]|nr:DC1 - like 10 [Theobroma cacao]
MPVLLKLKVDGHPHQLELKNNKVPFYCDGCMELGFGFCYQCPNKDCDYILHETCGIRRPQTFHKFFETCDFKFHKENPLGGTRVCDACALEIQGLLYQCSHGDKDLHPCCANLPPVFSLPGLDMEIYLRKEIESKCLKCQSRKRSSGKVQGWSYVSSDGAYCYHVACLRGALLENWKLGYFQLDVAAAADENTKTLALQKLAPKEVALQGRGQTSKATKGIKWLIIFLKLIIGDVSLNWKAPITNYKYTERLYYSRNLL